MGEKHNAEGGEWRRWAPGSRSQANEREGDVISPFSFLCSPLSWKLVNLHTCGGRAKTQHTKKSTHSAKKEAVRWGSGWHTWVSLHLGGAGMRANSISSLNADINQSISEERDSQGGLQGAGATAQNTVRHTGLNYRKGLLF